MSAMLLHKDKWSEFTGKLTGKNLWAPSKKDGMNKFVPVTEGETVQFGNDNTTVPPKALLFPQTETLYRFSQGQEDLDLPGLDEEMILLGVRPCDARAMAIVEKLFRWDFEDPYYLKRRELITIVGLACNEPELNCFCTSVGGGPASSEGLDVLMVDLGESYLLEAETEKGKALLEEVKDLLEEAGADALQQKEQVTKEAAAKIRRSVDPGGIPEALPGLWEDPLWARVSAACLGCGICTYLCPTCYCFDIQDEVEGTAGRRCRTWDSCMFAEYTVHTSGHNPRPTRRERTRNRINHKYSYFVDKFGVIACVGCGRCSTLCPVNIDLIDTLRQVKAAP
ncbi:MAG: (4Fe-4S)-binding protein [Firmicutes bacterium]|nr:(4Fe-4S)-binding protein [Bacillota bacterium]